MGADSRSRVVRAAVATAAAALVATATTFLAWGGSGERRRSSYDLVEVADRAGVVPAGVAGWTWVWFLVPALAGGVVLAAALHRTGTLGALSATLGVLMVTGAILVVRSPLTVQFGATAGGCAGLATIVGGTATVVLGRSERVDT